MLHCTLSQYVVPGTCKAQIRTIYVMYKYNFFKKLYVDLSLLQNLGISTGKDSLTEGRVHIIQNKDVDPKHSYAKK